MRFDFTRSEYEFFIRECRFNPLERCIFDLKVSGNTNVYIAEEIGYCERTVERHLKNIKGKMKRVV